MLLCSGQFQIAISNASKWPAVVVELFSISFCCSTTNVVHVKQCVNVLEFDLTCLCIYMYYMVVVLSSRETWKGRGVSLLQWLWTLAAPNQIQKSQNPNLSLILLIRLIQMVLRTGWSWVEVSRTETSPSHSTWREGLTAVQVCLCLYVCTICTGCAVHCSKLYDIAFMHLNMCVWPRE